MREKAVLLLLDPISNFFFLRLLTKKKKKKKLDLLLILQLIIKGIYICIHFKMQENNNLRKSVRRITEEVLFQILS